MMSFTLTSAPWDTRVLGLRAAAATIEAGPLNTDEIALAAADRAFELVSLRASEEFSAGGLFRIGELRTFALRPKARSQLGSIIELSREADVPSVDHFGQLGFGGRYERDPRLLSRAAAVYREWVLDAVADRARVVLAMTDASAIGVLRLRPQRVLELIAVHSDARGRGIGRSMLGALLHGASTVTAVGGYTDNAAAMRLYAEHGQTVTSFFRYHLWISDMQVSLR